MQNSIIDCSKMILKNIREEDIIMLQFVLGPSGSGKTEYIQRKIVGEAYDNPDTDYLFLVPEQSSMSIQTRLASLHRKKGFFNIEVFGFNRLAYSVFQELNVKTEGVLDDFGKSMLIRRVAGEQKLAYFTSSIDKNGFIDQVKSFMSELYQYDVSKEKLETVIRELATDAINNSTVNKLKDILLIMEGFDKYMNEHSMIVAEQLMTVLVDRLSMSRKLENTVVILDGFTGFTPIQLNVLAKLMSKVKKIYALVTIDEENYHRTSVGEHELFYLSSRTIAALRDIAMQTGTKLEADIWPCDFGEDIHKRWESDVFEHLERNIFRFPYERYDAVDEAEKQAKIKELNKTLHLSSFESSMSEISNVAGLIRALVNEKEYRYKDIAVISGDLEHTARLVDRIFGKYDIRYFIDKNNPVRSNNIINGILSLLDMTDDNMSYESVFAFLRSGIFPDSLLTPVEIERLENFVLKYGIKGFKVWNSNWPGGDIENARAGFMSLVANIVEKYASGRHAVSEYVDVLWAFINHDRLEITDRIEKRLYDAIMDILQKLDDIMGDERLDVHEFKEIFKVGLSKLELGVIPPGIDMVTIGDITRTRLQDVKLVFVVGANAGVIPKVNNRAQIIDDNERSRIIECGLELAPSGAVNDYMEQFYLYLNLTKPSRELYISYTTGKDDADSEKEPSYLVNVIKKLYPKLSVNKDYFVEGVMSGHALSDKAALSRLTSLVVRYRNGDEECRDELVSLLGYFARKEDDEKNVIAMLKEAMLYSNVPKNLRPELIELIKKELLSMSASQVEAYAECAFSYYMKYILRLKEREVKTINSLDFGVIIHDSLKKLYKAMAEKKEEHLKSFVWGDASTIHYTDTSGFSSDFEKMIYNAVDEVYQEKYVGFKTEEKFEVMKNNIIRVATTAIGKLFVNCDGDGFVPSYFEYPYTRVLKASDNSDITIVGRIDRTDIKPATGDGSTSEQIRVIDYKSGKEEFDIAKVYEGLQLQLIMYLNAMKEIRENKYKATVVPDGAYYYHMVDNWNTDKTEKGAIRKRNAQYNLDGIGESNDVYAGNLETVMKFADAKIVELVDRIISGDISKLPYKASNPKEQCEYCSFKAVCRFDDANGGNDYKKKCFTGSGKAVSLAVLDKMKGGNW